MANTVGADALSAYRVVLAVDPGSAKCGLALVSSPPFTLLQRRIAPTQQLAEEAASLLQSYPAAEIVIGSGTGSPALIDALQKALPDRLIHKVDERDTSRHARERYCRENPARGLRRLLPAGLRSPEEPYDDYVAVLLAERFLQRSKP
ncbi:MAG TPA: hypothetical protein VFW40_13485 [Capsulimonadaceae bacterium]|nr:hypothetical protein [Capsulimonadaceae bacterium]